MCMSHAAFTIIEMLMVVIIVLLLGSLLLVGANILSEQRKPIMTKNSIRTILSVLGASGAQSGSISGTVEHPLAGSADTASAGGSGRPRFNRKLGGALVSVTGEALDVANDAWIPGAQSRAIKADDCYDGIVSSGDLPFLFGLERKMCRILGGTVGIGKPASSYPGITAFRLLNQPRPGATTLPGGPNFDNSSFPNPFHLISPIGEDGTSFNSLESVQLRSLESTLGTGGMDELARLGCIKTTTGTTIWSPSTLYNSGVMVSNAGRYYRCIVGGTSGTGGPASTADDITDGAVHWSYEGALILQRRAYVGRAESQLMPSWSAGCYQRSADLQWQVYRLRGTVVVDAWGREMLCWNQDGLRLASAGKDGVFLCNPGPNRAINSAASTAQATRGGDDLDGTVDNIVSQQ